MPHANRVRSALATTSGFVLAVGAAIAACSNADAPGSPSSPYTEAGLPNLGRDSGTIANDAGERLKGLTPPNDPGAGAVYVTASGEVNALSGYPFPPHDWSNDTYLFDGWQLQIEKYIVVLDHLTLWSNPNTDPNKQQVHGGQVAHVDGPFVVDLHRGGSLAGQGGGGERATPIAAITEQNDNGGAALDPTATYGFGFSTVAASYAPPSAEEPGPFNVNLTSADEADFDLMVQNGYGVLYVGSAQWMGSQSPYGCSQTNAGAGPGAADAGQSGEAGVSAGTDGGYDFSKMPPKMTFRLGFSTPTNYVNCQNMTLQGMPVGNEDYPRGIQVSPSQSVLAQVTLHMDHPFWESFAEDSPVHWDPIAAQYVGAPGAPEATVEDMVGVPFYAFVDKAGTPLPWRNCSGTHYTPPNNGQMVYGTLSVPVDPKGVCVQGNCPAIRDFADYLRYSQSTQGHLNSQGLCYIDRQYPAPRGGS